MLVGGLAVLTASSLVGGLADSLPVLVTARGGQLKPATYISP